MRRIFKVLAWAWVAALWLAAVWVSVEASLVSWVVGTFCWSVTAGLSFFGLLMLHENGTVRMTDAALGFSACCLWASSAVFMVLIGWFMVASIRESGDFFSVFVPLMCFVGLSMLALAEVFGDRRDW